MSEKTIKRYKLVIFDLDGTLTPERASSAAPLERRLLPRVKEKCQELRYSGTLLAIATNQRLAPQPELGNHLAWITNELFISDFMSVVLAEYMKPSSYMIQGLVTRLGKTSNDTLMVGDSIEDQKAAESAGVDFEWAKDFFGWEDKND